MHLILPLGGRGSRMRPHSHHRPKALFRMAGRPVLGHVADGLADLPIERATLILGPDGAPIEAWAREHLPWPVDFALQVEPLGQAAAIALARDRIAGPTLVVFADTLFELDPWPLIAPPAGLDGLLQVQEVEDPSARGVALLAQDGRVERLVEKPSEPLSKLAVMGAYWLRDGQALLAAIDHIMAQGRRSKGEYYLADALQQMIEAGARFETRTAVAWHEAGNVADSLRAHGYLLERRLAKGASELDALAAAHPSTTFHPPVYVGPDVRLCDSVIGPRVWIEAGCHVEHSRLGPDLSLGAGSRVRQSQLRGSITEREQRIEDSVLEDSVLGQRVRLCGTRGTFDLGDDSRVDPPAAIIAP